MVSPISSDFTIVNVNVGSHKREVYNPSEEKYEKIKVHAEEQIKAITNILTEQKPTLVYVQEFTWKGLHTGTTFPRLKIPKHYKFFGNKDSGFIYDENSINYERLDLRSSVRGTYELIIAQQKSDPYFDIRRLCLCKIKSVGPPEFELLCACWHGPHNGFSDKKKKDHLRSLLKFLLKFKFECGNLPLLVGGDFNLDSGDVGDILVEISDELKLEDILDHIMLWIHCSDFRKNFYVDKPRSCEKAAFDHSVLTMEVEVTTPAVNFKRLYGISQPQSPLNHPQIIERKTDSFEYRLRIRETKKCEGPQMISVSWHGAYDEYSDEAKQDSFNGTLAFLLLEIQNHLAKSGNEFPLLEGYAQLNVHELFKGEPVKENIHCRRNTLDNWIMRSFDSSLIQVGNENQSSLDSDGIIIYLPQMSTQHECPAKTSSIIHQRLPNAILPNQQYFVLRDNSPHWCPPHYCPPPSSPPDERHVENANPVDIHLDILNVELLFHRELLYTVNGYLKKCIYLQSKSPD